MTTRPLTRRPRTYFTIEEANRTLPLVRRIVADAVEHFRRVGELRARIDGARRAPVAAERPGAGYGPRQEDYLGELQDELETLEEQLAEYRRELEQIGVDLKNADGHCEFLSTRNGRDIALSWRPGEDQVLYWHELDSGTASRKPLYDKNAPAPHTPGNSNEH